MIARDCTVIHLDIDPAEIGKNIAVDIPIVGDARQVLNALAEQVPSSAVRTGWPGWWICAAATPPNPWAATRPMSTPKEFFLRLSEKAPDNAVLTADVGRTKSGPPTTTR